MRTVALISAAFILLALTCIPAAAEDNLSGALLEVLHEQGVIDDAKYDEIKKAGEAGGEKAMARSLVEALHDNGTLSDETYQRLVRKDEAVTADKAAAAAQERPASPRPAGSGGRPAEGALASAEEGFARLAGDDIRLKLGAWVQGGYVYDSAGSNEGALPGSSAVNTGSSNSFHIRHARPYFNFSFREKIGFRLMLDATGSPPLRDVFVWFDYIPYTRVTFGQFLTPFGSESWRAPFENPMINYSLATTLMQFTNFRDTGVMVSSKFNTTIGGLPFGAGFATAVINGNGINTSDDNNLKDSIGRAWIEPFLPGLQVGGSWYAGKAHTEFRITDEADPSIVLHQGKFESDWDRWGAEMNYEPAFAKGLAFRAEYLYQRKFYNTPLRMVHSEGWYVQASYRPDVFSGGLSFLNDFQAALRYEELDEDISVDDDERTRWTVGMNYWFNRYLRLLVNYEIIKADLGLNPVTGKTIMPRGIDRINHEVLTTHLQLWF